MGLSVEGFYRPHVDPPELCTRCSLCAKVCSAANPPAASADRKVDAYAAVTNDSHTLASCSSGGAAFEIAAVLLGQGYRACGVRYNTDSQSAEHFVASSLEEYQPSKGSKYLQSDAQAAFRQALGPGKWVVFGTPCQIASLRTYTTLTKRNADYVLVDFFCHGVPSHWLWRSYLAHLGKRFHVGQPTSVSFRDKRNGWGEYTLAVSDSVHEVASTARNNDLFLSFFLSDLCLNAPCYRCQFKLTASAADIRIGDLWGRAYADDARGVSGVLALTDRGSEVLRALAPRCKLTSQSLAVVAEGQMASSPPLPPGRERLLRRLKDGSSLRLLFMRYVVPVKAKRKLAHIMKHLKKGAA